MTSIELKSVKSICILEQCPVNIVTRKICQFCRYAKCTAIGMKPKWYKIKMKEFLLEKILFISIGFYRIKNVKKNMVQDENVIGKIVQLKKIQIFLNF